MRGCPRRGRGRAGKLTSGLAAAVLLFVAVFSNANRPAAAANPATAIPPALLRGVREAGALRAALASLDIPAGDPVRGPVFRLFASGAWPLRSDRIQLATDPVDRADAAAALQRLLGRPLPAVAGAATARSAASAPPVATREDLAVWAAIAAGLNPVAPGAGGVGAFADADAVASDRLPHVEAAYRAGLLDGVLVGGDTRRLRPADAVNLGQFARIIDRLRERGAFSDWGPLITARVASATEESRIGPAGPVRLRAWSLQAGDGELHRLEVQRSGDGDILREIVDARAGGFVFSDELRAGDRVQYVVRGAEVALLEQAGEAIAHQAVIRRVGRQPASVTLEVDGVPGTYELAPGVAVTYGGYPAAWSDVRPGLAASVEVIAGRVTRIDVAWSGPVVAYRARPVTGVVVRFEDDVLTVREAGGRLFSFVVDSSTRTVSDGQVADRTALQTGDTVTVMPAGSGYYRAARIEVSSVAGSPVEVYRARLDEFLPERGLLQLSDLARWDWGTWSPVAALSRFELADGAPLFLNDAASAPLDFAEGARGQPVYFAAQRRAGRQVAVKVSAGPAQTSALNGLGYLLSDGGIALNVGCCTPATDSRVRLGVSAATIAVRDGRLVDPSLPRDGIHYFAAVAAGPGGLVESTASRAVVLTRDTLLPPGTRLAWGLAATSRGETLSLLPYRMFGERAWGIEYSGSSDPIRLAFAPQPSIRDLTPATPQYVSAEALRLGTLTGYTGYWGNIVYAWQRGGGIAAVDVQPYSSSLTPASQTVALAVVDAVYGTGDTLQLRNLQTWDSSYERWTSGSGTFPVGITRALLVDGDGRLEAGILAPGDRVAVIYQGAEAAVLVRRSIVSLDADWP